MACGLYRRAQWWAQRGAPRRALRLYDQALAAGADDSGAWLWSGVALAELGRFEQALDRVERGGGRALPAARVLFDAGRYGEACERLKPLAAANDYAATLLAAVLVSQGEVAGAAEVLPRRLPPAPWVLARLLAAIEQRTPLPAESPAPLPEARARRGSVRRGLVLLREERWLEAFAVFQAAGDSALAGYGRGVALYYLQHLDPALDALGPVAGALEEPFASDALSILGKVDLERGRISEGVLRLRRAIARGAATPENYYALGIGLLRKGAVRRAVRAFERCVSAEFLQRRFGDFRAIIGPQ